MCAWKAGDPDRRRPGITINNDKGSTEEGPKAFGAVVAILAVIGGMAAIIMPMNQSIQSLRDQIKEDRVALESHAQIKGHPGIMAEVAALGQRFAETETQFKWQKEVFENEKADVHRRIDKIEQDTTAHALASAVKNSTQDEKLITIQNEIIRLDHQIEKCNDVVNRREIK
jgi:SMC interacting uncharacterized protein involved in chromosome segregation